MSDLIWQGLTLSVTGISLTFLALGLLVLTMILLERLFRPQPSVSDETELKEAPAVSALDRDTEDEEIAAAIAVALAYLHSLDIYQGELGSTLEAGHGSWWMVGRAQQRSVRTSRVTQWRN